MDIDEDQKPPIIDKDHASTKDSLDNEVDELDDFEDEEEGDDGFQIRNRIERPDAKLYTTRELHALIHEGAIDLSPAYQRDVVWPEIKQTHLIDSIFRHFYIPPIIFAVQDDDGEKIRICVDGKQRLTSIQKFFDGQIPHRDHVTKKSYWYTLSETNKKSRLEIPQKYKDWFSKQEITCVEYTHLTPGMERDIFQRVQMGVPLVAAEKLQAIDSPWARWLSSLEQKHVHSDEGLSTILDWDHSRGRAFQCLAHMVYLCDGVSERPLPTAQKITKWIDRVDPPPDGFKEDIENALQEFWVIAGDKTRGYDKGFRLIGKRVAPVEFAFVGLLMYVMRDANDFSRRERSETVFEMRTYIRKHFRDIRNNTDVGRRLWHFVQSIQNPGSVSLDEVLDGPARRKKRKAAKGDDDDDGEYRPDAIRHLGTPVKTRSTKKR